MQSAHLPLVFSAVVEVLRVRTHLYTNARSNLFMAVQDQIVSQRAAMARASIQELMPLLTIITERSTATALATALELPSRGDTVALGPYSTACQFYGLAMGCTLEDSRARSNVPAATILEDLSLVASVSAQTTTRTTRSITVRALGLMLDLLKSFAGQKIALGSKLEWDPDEWMVGMLSAVEGEVRTTTLTTLFGWQIDGGFQHATFVEIDRVVSLVIAMQETPGLAPIVSLRPRHTVFRLVNLVSKIFLVSRLRPVDTVVAFEVADLSALAFKVSPTRLLSIPSTLRQPHLGSRRLYQRPPHRIYHCSSAHFA